MSDRRSLTKETQETQETQNVSQRDLKARDLSLELTLDINEVQELRSLGEGQEPAAPEVMVDDREPQDLDETMDHDTSLGVKRISYGLQRGARLEHFEILRELGRGGMGTVYEAFNHTLSRRVALKILHVKRGASLSSLKSEARSIAQLEHPNIVQVYHLGELKHDAERALYIEMQLVNGRPLSDLIEEERLGLPRAVNLLIQILKALQHAHERGVIHRDVKPDNVIVTPEGVVKLVDFGISAELNKRAGRARGARAGTPAYMSPEVWTEGDWSVRSDLYAFGVSAYLILSGQLPYSFPAHSSWESVMETHLRGELKPLELTPPLPKALHALLITCLDKRPSRRPRSAQELIDELERHQDELNSVTSERGQADRPSMVSSVLWWWHKQRQLIMTLLILSLVNVVSVQQGLFKGLDDDALDVLQSLQPAPERLPVGLVALDEAAYMNEERHMNRSALATVLDTLLQAGATAIGVDLVQNRPSPEGLELRDEDWQEMSRDARVILSIAPSKVTSNVQRSALHSTEGALRARHAIQLIFDKRSPEPSALSLTEDEAQSAKAYRLTEAQARDEYVEEVNSSSERYLDLAFKRTRNRYQRLQSVPSLILPYPQLLESTNALGHINLEVDQDGVIRRVPLLVRYEDKVFPSLGLLLAMRMLNAGLQDLDYIADTVVLSPPGQAPIYIPVDETGAMNLRVRGGSNHRSHLPLLLITQAEEASQLSLNAEAYIVGATATIAGDWGAISHWHHVPLSLAHVLVAENIINRDFIYPLRLCWLLSVTLLVSLLAFLVTLRGRAEWRVIMTFTAMASVVSLCLLLLLSFNIDLPLVTIASQVLIACLFGMTLTELRSRDAQRALTARLDEALPPRVAQAIINGNDAPKRLVKPQRRLVTLVCVELAPFDQLADQLPPKALTALLDHLSEDLQQLALHHGGLTVPSHRGGTLVAFLRSSGKKGSADALRFAVDLRSRWREGLWRWRQEHKTPTLNLSIGQGRCAWGTLGVARRAELYVQGSFVERLESMAHLAQDQILMSQDVIKELSPDQQGQQTMIHLKGRASSPSLSLTLSPGPSLNRPLEGDEEPLTCYYLTASHQG